MQRWSLQSFIVYAVFLSCQADKISVSPSPAPNPDVNSDGEEVRQGVMSLFQDRINHGDAVLKEQLRDSISNLKELLQGKDSYLDVRISDVLARSNLQDDQLNEDHARDIAWLKERMTKDLIYLKELMEEGRVKTNEELTKVKEALGKPSCIIGQSGGAVVDDLRQQVTDIQAKLETTRQQLLEARQASTALSAQLQTAEQAIRSLKVEMDSVQSNHNRLSSEMGSTFIRWGRATCPDNTTLVYSGYVGGQMWNETGGGSNYLCLVEDPQLDNMTLSKRYNSVQGVEYEDIKGHHEREAVCSMCRAPQVTTLMIPATFTCPLGWTTQYRGHLVSGHFESKGRNEFVCLDQVMEHREGGHGEAIAEANFFYVVSQCHSLPCPPFAEKVVTCVVCSM